MRMAITKEGKVVVEKNEKIAKRRNSLFCFTTL